jgi:hypothetical protein
VHTEKLHQPNFFLAGTVKAGTTSLYHYLAQHPQIYMSPIKEPCFFATELRPANFVPEFQPQMFREQEAAHRYLEGPMTQTRFGGPIVTWEDYLKLFRNVHGETAVGEASVSYLWSRTAARNIAKRIPSARIVLVLRNPADRAYSQYLQAVSAGQVRTSFREQIQASMRRGPESKFDVLNPLLEFGRYFEQVQRFFQHFPREQVRVDLYEDYRANPKQTLADLYRFLEVDPTFQPDLTKRFLEPSVPQFITAAYFLKRYGVWQKIKRWSPKPIRPALKSAAVRKRASLVMDPADRAHLREYYRDDIGKLSALLGRDLRIWLLE